MKVLVFPKDSNPYQRLLYERMTDDIQIEYLAPSFETKIDLVLYFPRIICQLINNRLRGDRLIHIHWLYGLGVTARIPAYRFWSLLQTLGFFAALLLLRYKVIWTVHNVLPHDPITNHDLLMRRLLARLVSVKIIHSHSTMEAMRKAGLNISDCVVIPHGNYFGVYPNTVSKSAARKKLSIPQDCIVVTFFGAIKPYKNISALLTAFEAIMPLHPEVYLVIAGSCSDAAIKHQLETFAAAHKSRVCLQLGFAADYDIQYYFNAADVTAFPFSEITTSGSVILAATFGKPIVSPYVGALQDIPKSVGILYSTEDARGLEMALLKVISDPASTDRMAAASKTYANSLSWNIIAAKTADTYRMALQS